MRKKLLLILAVLCLMGILWAGDETATLTSSVERRNQEPFVKPVWEHVITWTYDADDAGLEAQAVPINGILLKIVIDIPATNTTGTTSQVLIKDNGDHTIFDSGEQAESDTVPYLFSVFEPLTGTIDISIEPSAAAGTGGSTPVVTLRGF